MIAVVAVLPGLDHALSHEAPDRFVAHRRRLLEGLAGAPRCGLLLDGAWALFDAPEVAFEAALEVAASGAAVALHPAGHTSAQDPPIGAGVRWADQAAHAVRSGEVVVPGALAGLALAPGVARLTAPAALHTLLGPVDLIRDYRGMV